MLRAEINTGGNSVKKKETLRQTGVSGEQTDNEI